MAAKKRDPEKLELVEHDGGLYFKARHLLDLLWLRETSRARDLAKLDGIEGTAVGLVFEEWRVRQDLPAVLFFGGINRPGIATIGRLFFPVSEGFPEGLLPAKHSEKIVGVWCYYQVLDLDDATFWYGKERDGFPGQEPKAPIIDWDIAKPLRELRTSDIGGGHSCLIGGEPSAIVGGVPVSPPVPDGEKKAERSVEGTVAHAFHQDGKRYVLTVGHAVDADSPVIFGWRKPKRKPGGVTRIKLRPPPPDQTGADYFSRLQVPDALIPPLGGHGLEEKLFEVDCALAEVTSPLEVDTGTYSCRPPCPDRYSRQLKELQPVQLQRRLGKVRFWPVGEDVLTVGPETGRQLGRILGFATWTKKLGMTGKGLYQDYALVSLPGYRLNADGDSGKPFLTVRGNHLLGMLVGSLYPGDPPREFIRDLRARAMDIQRAMTLLKEQLTRQSADKTNNKTKTRDA